MGHTGHSSVAVSEALAPGDADRALTAQVAGNEVAGRLGAAMLLGPHNGQFWSSIHCASGAVAAGVALGLDGPRIGHALAIALYQPPYGLWPGFMGPRTKLLTAAEPAVQGVRAALLAAEGVDGPLGIVEDRRGLLRHLAFAGRPAMLGELGRVWLTDTLAFKPYPGCAYLQPAVDAILRAGIPAEEIAGAEVAAGYLTVAMERLGARRERTSAVIGPCIGRDSYEVGPEFPAPFLAQDEDNKNFFKSSPRAGHFIFDLAGYLVLRAENGGAPSALMNQPIPDATYADTTVKPGTRYTYTVVAVDKAGNRSPPSNAVEEIR